MRKKIVAICTGVVVVAGTVTLVVFNNKKTNADEKTTIIETMTEQETTTQIETTTEKESTTKEETTEVETTSEESKEQETQQQNIEALDKTMYATSTANVRSGADTGTSLVGKLYGGMSVHVTGVTGEWYEIEFNNSKAYVHNSLLSDTEPVYQEPETQAPQPQQVYQEPETQAPAPVYTEPETQAPQQQQQSSSNDDRTTVDDLDNVQTYVNEYGDTVSYGTYTFDDGHTETAIIVGGLD